MAQLKKRRRAFARLFAKREAEIYESLSEMARKIARGDEALKQDLVQTGVAEVWMNATVVMLFPYPVPTALRFARRAMKRYVHRQELKQTRIRERLWRRRDIPIVRMHMDSMVAEAMEQRHDEQQHEVIDVPAVLRELDRALKEGGDTSRGRKAA